MLKMVDIYNKQMEQRNLKTLHSRTSKQYSRKENLFQTSNERSLEQIEE